VDVDGEKATVWAPLLLPTLFSVSFPANLVQAASARRAKMRWNVAGVKAPPMGLRAPAAPAPSIALQIDQAI
jgi:hypothetical protein